MTIHDSGQNSDWNYLITFAFYSKYQSRSKMHQNEIDGTDSTFLSNYIFTFSVGISLEKQMTTEFLKNSAEIPKPSGFSIRNSTIILIIIGYGVVH